jgi:predicted metal-dependent phosphoesterase TrpH
MINAEFHCHSIYSQDSLSKIDRILEACQHKDIHRIAITDHNTLAGAQIAKQIDPDRVIVGEEINTRDGEILAYFVREFVPPGLSPEETIKLLHNQGAFISVAHPFDRYRGGHWEVEVLERIWPLIDGIEIFNARCIQNEDNNKAKDFAKSKGVAGLVGSDAHIPAEIGTSYLELPDFQDAESLKRALGNAAYHTRLSPPWIHLTTRYASLYKQLFNQ